MIIERDTIRRELFFSQGEYDARLAGIRADMGRAGIDTLILSGPENILYVSGYQTFGFNTYQMLVIPPEGKPFLILRFLESILAARYSWTDDIVTFSDTDDPVDVTLKALRDRGLDKGTVGVEERSNFYHVATWKKMVGALPRLVNGSGVCDLSRAVKSPAELAYMREAARITDIGIRAALDEAAEGKTDNDLAAAAFDAMTRAGAEYSMRDPIVTTGDRSGLPHSCYMRQKLGQGDAILLEFSGVYMRYYAPRMHGAVIGKPSAEIRGMADACIEALNAAMDAIRPGVTSGEVDDASRGVMVRAGYWENYRKRAGYSVGLGMATWIESGVGALSENNPMVLKPGMCFHLPMALRQYGRSGLGFSETIVVTETGCERLGTLTPELTVC